MEQAVTDRTHAFTAYGAYEEVQQQIPVNEYMLVASLPESLSEKIMHVRKEFSDRFHVPAVAGKPYCALLRFTQAQSLETKIIDQLHLICMRAGPFKTVWQDYGFYPAHSMYIALANPGPTQAFIKSFRPVQWLLRYGKEKPHFIHTPQIFIATGIDHDHYNQIEQVYRHRSFTGMFICNSVLLLKRRKGSFSWQILQRFALENLYIPSQESKQASLFS